MNPRTGGPLVWTEQFRYSTKLDSLEDVPIQVWSTKSLTARWNGSHAEALPTELVDSGQVLSGSITNTLGVPLRDCILAHGLMAYELVALQPGESVRVGTMTRRSELKTLLTGRKIVYNEANDHRSDNYSDVYHHEVTPYDQSSVDLPYILRTMMFYDKTGGRRYTGYWNAYQSFVDFSNLLKTGRAILVAQGPSLPSDAYHGAQLLRDGQPLVGSQDQHITMYRFVFPVKKE